jgi:hypothetical protein
LWGGVDWYGIFGLLLIFLEEHASCRMGMRGLGWLWIALGSTLRTTGFGIESMPSGNPKHVTRMDQGTHGSPVQIIWMIVFEVKRREVCTCLLVTWLGAVLWGRMNKRSKRAKKREGKTQRVRCLGAAVISFSVILVLFVSSLCEDPPFYIHFMTHSICASHGKIKAAKSHTVFASSTEQGTFYS